MSNLSLHAITAYIAALEKEALASTDPDIQAMGAAATNVLASVGELVNKAKAFAPKAAVLLVNAGIAEIAKSEPVFALLIPAEVFIDPAVSGLASAAESLLLGAPKASETPQLPQ